MSKLLGLLFVVLVGYLVVRNWPSIKRSIRKANQATTSTKPAMLSDEELISHVKKAILPQFKDWVLFANGTYIIIEDSTVKDKPKAAIELMKKYGPVHVGSPTADFGVIDLTHTEGWVVDGHYGAMYTYVHPSELGKEDPSDAEIGLKGRAKRDMDGKAPKVIYVND